MTVRQGSRRNEPRAKHGVRVLGNCLMPNHVHVVATPAREESLNLAAGRTHLLYTQCITRLHGRSNHLWQRRYEAHAVAAMRYIENNPVRAERTRNTLSYGARSRRLR